MEYMPDAMRWLRAGLPLTLFIDLLDDAGPDSESILSNEPADLSWTTGLHAA